MLDTTTLRVAFGVAALTLLMLSYFVTYRAARTAYSAWWCAALALFLAGSAAYLLDGTSYQAWGNPLGNTLLVMGAASVWAGVRSLRADRPKVWQLAAGPAVAAAASALDHPATNSWPGDAVFFALMCLLFALACREQWILEPSYSRVHRPMAVAGGLLAGYYFCRWVAFLLAGPSGYVYSTYFGSDTTTLFTMALLVAVSFSMAALSNEQMTRALTTRATHDGLTGLLNRAAFLELATDELRRLNRAQTGATLILADLDHFKKINDTHGHIAGDSALKSFAAACASAVRSTDLVCRYGGEEFIFLLPGADLDRAEKIAAQISRQLQAKDASHDFPMPTVSYGLASVDPGIIHLSEVIASADTALYRAKSLGRNRSVRME